MNVSEKRPRRDDDPVPGGAKGAADGLSGLRAQMESAERKVAGEFEPSGSLVVGSIAMCAVMVALLLPHTGNVSGLDILFGDDRADGAAVVITSKIFVWLSLVFGVVLSGIALLSRRWIIAVIAGGGCAVGVVFGVLSVWSRNTTGLHGEPPSGVGVGLLLGGFALTVLAVVWLRTIWSRSRYQLALEDDRRAAALEWEAQLREQHERFRNPGGPADDRPRGDQPRDDREDRPRDA